MSSIANSTPALIPFRSLMSKDTMTLVWELDPSYLSLGIMAGVKVPNISTKAQADEIAWKRVEWLQKRSNVQDLVRSTVRKLSKTDGDGSWQESVMDLSRDVYQLGSMARTGNQPQSNTQGSECKTWKGLEEQAKALEGDRVRFLGWLQSLVAEESKLPLHSVQKCMEAGHDRRGRLTELSSMSFTQREQFKYFMDDVSTLETSLINTASSLLSHKDERFAPTKQTEVSPV